VPDTPQDVPMGSLAFIASLVGSLAWPVFVLALVCIIWFSLPNEARLNLTSRIREIGAHGVKFDQIQEEQARSQIARASGAIVNSPSGSAAGSIDWSGTAHGTAAPDPDEPDEPREMDTQALRETQRLITAAARWGWIRAGRDTAQFPYPLVTWDKDGARIVATRDFSPGETVTFAAGSFIDPNTGKPNTSARSIIIEDVDPL
jgi:hypothetical protein